jgi:hypothetical protein
MQLNNFQTREIPFLLATCKVLLHGVFNANKNFTTFCC